jgi:hypothetical protein
VKISTIRALALGLPALLGGTACQAQVGDHYTGEVQFTLRGNVNVDPDTTLVPRLGFLSRGGLALVDGVLTGEYPRRFQLDVTEPPPNDALIDFNNPGSELDIAGKLAVGAILLLPPELPSFLPYLDISSSSDCPGEDVCVTQESACAPGGGPCRERTLECRQEACETLARIGDPTLQQEPGARAYTQQYGTVSYTLISACDPAGNCYREYLACDHTDLGPYDSVWQTYVERCSLLSESGDAGSFDYRDIQTAGAALELLYATRANPDFPRGPLEPGYNLIQYHVPTADEVVSAPLTCKEDAPAECTWEIQARIVGSEEIQIDLGPL